MGVRSTSATLVLERPTDARQRTVRTTECGGATGVANELSSENGEQEVIGGLGFLLRAPGLMVLASVFLIEGYRWLGVLHLGGSAAGSLLFGSVGLATGALLAPFAALVLTSGRRAPGVVVVEDLVIALALLVTVATGMALIVGGPAWRAVAGTSDLVLAAAALGAVILGERAHRRWTGQ